MPELWTLGCYAHDTDPTIECVVAHLPGELGVGVALGYWIDVGILHPFLVHPSQCLAAVLAWLLRGFFRASSVCSVAHTSISSVTVSWEFSPLLATGRRIKANGWRVSSGIPT